MSQNSVSAPWYIPHRCIPQIPTLHGQSFPTPKTDSANNRLALKGREESPKILDNTEKRWREVIITQKNMTTSSLSQPLLLKDIHSETTISDLI